MEQRNQNLMLASVINANQSTKLDKNQKFIIYCGSRKENVISSIRPPYDCKTFQELKVYNCPSSLNVANFPPGPTEDLETLENILKNDVNSKRPEKSLKIKKELSKCRNELREFTNNTKELEEKYTIINSELSEMKQKYNYFVQNMDCDEFDSSSSDCHAPTNEHSLRRKCTQIFRRSNSFIKILSNEPLKEFNYELPKKGTRTADVHKSENVQRVECQPENKENMVTLCTSSSFNKSSEVEYLDCKSGLNDQTKSRRGAKASSLKKTVARLQSDSERLYSIIEQQKKTLSDYRLGFVKAQHLVQEQRIEIDQLGSKNEQLEKDASAIIEELHRKIDIKLRDVGDLSDKMRADQIKRDYVMKENDMLNERIHVLEAEAKELKLKLEEMNRRKMATIARLKVAERDLKIFKNYNGALKQEKRKLYEDMKELNDQLANMQEVSKRTMSRHREQSEKQRRLMQKRIFDLEMKLNRSQNSTTGLIQERDSLIAELQSQLNNLVHNFEVSQKHIRVLRRHIYSTCENNSRQSIVRNRALG